MEDKKIENTNTLNNTKIITIPNILSFLRLILAFLFILAYDQTGGLKTNITAIIILALSGITDFFDGKIARKFNMISEFGKILDPIADKVTEAILAISLLEKYKIMIILLIIFIIKETFMGINGIRVIKKTGENQGARWYGKISTFVFYIAMIILLLVSDISIVIANIIIGICIATMTFSFIMYAKLYHELCKNKELKSNVDK